MPKYQLYTEKKKRNKFKRQKIANRGQFFLANINPLSYIRPPPTNIGPLNLSFVSMQGQGALTEIKDI